MLSVALSGFIAVGEKVTLTVHFAPAASEPQVVVATYGGSSEVNAESTVTVEVPVFVTVTG